ncbi:inhibitor of growth protein 3 isoform X3 [Acinonyx jubatus]|uniref:Inhibitor of growth protein 3 isoform X3 n=1 Tax=Acinonyx jubatus TaxID=32536 RepID=A0ABM3PR30_ACIJB|nr:inhibitor of growth protein 3 isoform X3 [Acinonyx jubatus]
MLYLEDYLEMIEQLPMDLRDRFTEMREMDLQVQNAMDQLEQRVSEFFMNAKKNKPEWREEQMASIKKDYYKALEDADEKVQLANQIYDLAERGRVWGRSRERETQNPKQAPGSERAAQSLMRGPNS